MVFDEFMGRSIRKLVLAGTLIGTDCSVITIALGHCTEYGVQPVSWLIVAASQINHLSRKQLARWSLSFQTH